MPRTSVPYKLTEEQQQLAVQFYPLAFRCLKLFSVITRCYKDKEDAKSQALAGLVHAARYFRPDYMVGGKPVKFITYATNCIRNEMMEGLREQAKSAARIQRHHPLRLTNKALSFRQPDSRYVGWELEAKEQVDWILSKLSGKQLRYVKAYMEHETLRGASRAMGVSVEAIRQTIARVQIKFSGQRHPLGTWRREYEPVRPEQRGEKDTSRRHAGGSGEQVAGCAADDSGGSCRSAA